jgi:hypothetical protein
MAVEPQDAARFGRSSPVLWHWLGHSEGFSVRGLRGHGVVVRIYGAPGAPRTIVVRTRYSKRRLQIPAAAFAEVVPAKRLLVVESTLSRAARGERRPRRNVARPIARATVHGARLAVAAIGRGSAAGLRAGRAAALWLARAAWPPAKRGATIAGRLALRGARTAGTEGTRLARRASVATALRLQRGSWRGREIARVAADDGLRRGELLARRIRAGAAAARERREARARSALTEAPPTLVGDRPE